MVKFGGVDFIDFDSQLNDEEKLVRQTAREFVENEVIPVIEKHSREATFPMHLISQLGELGFFGANLHDYAAPSSVVASALNEKTSRRVTAHLPGGDLLIEWTDDDRVMMTGLATEVFEGEIDL